ncbi:hypothetical protein ADIWIN_1138 [Winogradskyella psychrotolerans RS-3]|uniref:Uncharacterized protein n=1 Tax=Winogradskyella psychrotolerans RS-3 TaxID=641526 RepID=S7XCR1_9FLAO|nr:hypothetical protein [Winogradskyella psychrotolerans]EPR73778.1 hypothetical protein ADIWIN_1138 [Winogradskyella psychrotolerans RS-3]
MKTKKLNPKTALLLGAGLDILHFESQEWLEDIAFWKDEARFFENLLKNKEAKNEAQKEHSKMLTTLDKIHKDLFEDLQATIMKHERQLSKIEDGKKGLADGTYREEHRKIKDRMTTFTNDFRAFKKIVFDYAKQL